MTTLPLDPTGLLGPAYADLVHPSAKRIGELAGRAVGAALSPIAGTVWGVEQIVEFVGYAMKRMLQYVPEDRIQAPPTNVAGPLLHALRFAGSTEGLREMYANLLAQSMDRDRAHLAHPAFVSVIQNLSPDEARILEYWCRSGRQAFAVLDVRCSRPDSSVSEILLPSYSAIGRLAGCERSDLTPNYLDNLRRQGLVDLRELVWLDAPQDEYSALRREPAVVAARAKAEATPGSQTDIDERCVRLTSFGAQFLDACVRAQPWAQV